MDPRSLHEDDWDYVRTLLPTDLEDSARLTQALRRCRNVPDAAALIRMALAYALTDLSLKDVAAWASSLNLAEITGSGLFYRLRQAEGLAGELPFDGLSRSGPVVLKIQLQQALGPAPSRYFEIDYCGAASSDHASRTGAGCHLHRPRWY